MVYVDELFQMESKNRSGYIVGKRHNHRWCHLYADSLDELISFANKIGLKRSWLQNESGRFPHFDIVPTYRQKAISNGAIELSLKTYIKMKYNKDKKYGKRKLPI